MRERRVERPAVFKSNCRGAWLRSGAEPDLRKRKERASSRRGTRPFALRDPRVECDGESSISARSKYSCEANHSAPLRSNRVPREQPSEVDDIENIVEVLSIRLKPHIDALGLVKVGSG